MAFSDGQRIFPHTRMRRMRADDFSRRLMRESHLSPADLIYPMFILDGQNQREAIPSMPGIERLSIDLAVEECKLLHSLGIPAVALFPVTPLEAKSLMAEEAYNPDGIAQRAVKAIKNAVPDPIAILMDINSAKFVENKRVKLIPIANPI